MTHVIDTSVLLKWVVPEDGSDLALAWVGSALVAPDLVRAELANALWKKVRRGEIDFHQASLALTEISTQLTLIPAAAWAEEALAVAFELSHPVYDCYFLALAQRLGTRLVTADKRLVRACAGTRFSEVVVLLGSALP